MQNAMPTSRLDAAASAGGVGSRPLRKARRAATRVVDKSSGSAMKFFGSEALPNGIAMGLLMCLSYATLVEADIVHDPGKVPAPELIQMTSDLQDAPAFRVAEDHGDISFQ